MLSEELGEGRYGNIKGIRAIVLFKLSEFRLRRDAGRFLKLPDLRLRLSVDLVGQGTEGFLRRVIEKTALLK